MSVDSASVVDGEGLGATIPTSSPDEIDRERTAYHESGHAVAARAFGYSAGPVTIVPGKNYAGLCFHGSSREKVAIGPVCLWPAAMKRVFEAEAIISLAGIAADELFDAERLARPRPPDHEETVRAVRAVLARHTGKLPRTERVKLQEANVRERGEDEVTQDWENALRAIGILALDDAVVLTPWLQHQARELVCYRWRSVRRLAAALLERETLSKREIRELFAADRPQVPPGAGS